MVYDMNGREAEEADIVLGALGDVGQYIFCSSAGVYLKSHQMPHHEVDAVDPKSRHKVEPPSLAATVNLRSLDHCKCWAMMLMYLNDKKSDAVCRHSVRVIVLYQQCA